MSSNLTASASRDPAAGIVGPSSGPLGRLVASAQSSEPGATDRLFTALYRQLHRLARREVARLGPHSALSTTTLLHEAYLDISRRDALVFPSEAHFMACAARAMRGLVIDSVRERQALKRGAGWRCRYAASAFISAYKSALPSKPMPGSSGSVT